MPPKNSIESDDEKRTRNFNHKNKKVLLPLAFNLTPNENMSGDLFQLCVTVNTNGIAEQNCGNKSSTKAISKDMKPEIFSSSGPSRFQDADLSDLCRAHRLPNLCVGNINKL